MLTTILTGATVGLVTLIGALLKRFTPEYEQQQHKALAETRKAEAEAAADLYKRMNEQMDDMRADISDLKAADQRHREENANLRDTIATVTEQRNAEQERANRLERERDAERARAEELQQRVTTLEKEVGELKRHVAAMEKQGNRGKRK